MDVTMHLTQRADGQNRTFTVEADVIKGSQFPTFISLIIRSNDSEICFFLDPTNAAEFYQKIGESVKKALRKLNQ